MPTIKDLVAKRKQFETDLVAKSLDDAAFRQKLLTDPKAAIAEMTGEAMPAGIEVRVIEEAPNSLTFVVPLRPADVSAEEELTDEALESVAGTGIIIPSVILNVVIHK